MHRGKGTENTTPPLGTVSRLGLWSRPTGRGSGREDDGDRQMETGTPGRDNPRSYKDLLTG